MYTVSPHMVPVKRNLMAHTTQFSNGTITAWHYQSLSKIINRVGRAWLEARHAKKMAHCDGAWTQCPGETAHIWHSQPPLALEL